MKIKHVNFKFKQTKKVKKYIFNVLMNNVIKEDTFYLTFYQQRNVRALVHYVMNNFIN